MQARTCVQLRRLLQDKGSNAMMKQLYSEYLMRRLESKKRGTKARGGGGGGRGRGRGRDNRSSAKR